MKKNSKMIRKDVLREKKDEKNRKSHRSSLTLSHIHLPTNTNTNKRNGDWQYISRKFSTTKKNVILLKTCEKE